MPHSKVVDTLRVFGAIAMLLDAADCLNRGESCQFIARGNEICSKIANCPSRIEELSEKYLEGEYEFSLYFHKYWCGMEDEEYLICCKSPTELEVTEDVSRHPNIALLRQDICGPISQDRITNGNKTSLFELPWMALLAYQEEDRYIYGCSGTIINDRYVLTAAHCLLYHIPEYVRLGEHDLNADTDCEEHFDGEKITKICAPKPQDIPIEDFIAHPNFVGSPPYYGDIALLRLSRPADFTTDAVRPICLPIGLSQQTLNLTGKMVDISGWGLTEKGIRSNELLKAIVPTTKHSKCPYWPLLSTVTQICAGGDINIADACRGDSGGPLAYVGEVEGSIRTLEYGIVSFGYDICGAVDLGSAYTHVGYYMKWILDNVKP